MRRPGREEAGGAAAAWPLRRLREQERIPVGDREVVYLYLSLAGAPEPADEALLDPAERERAARFVRPEHAHRFVRAHAGLRLVLARCLGVEPGGVRYVSGAQGKPALAGLRGVLEFNLSHADELGLVAVSRGGPVGVDVERVRALPDALQIADAHFSVAEREALRGTREADRSLAFLRTWTRKEALVKATGDGFGDGTAALEVGSGAAGPALVRAGPPAPGRLWALDELPAPPGHVAAGAVAAEGGKPVRWTGLVPPSPVV